MEEYDASAQNHNPGELSTEEGMTKPPKRTKRQLPGRRPVGQADGEAGERSDRYLCLTPNPRYRDRK